MPKRRGFVYRLQIINKFKALADADEQEMGTIPFITDVVHGKLSGDERTKAQQRVRMFIRELCNSGHAQKHEIDDGTVYFKIDFQKLGYNG